MEKFEKLHKTIFKFGKNYENPGKMFDKVDTFQMYGSIFSSFGKYRYSKCTTKIVS